RLQHGGNRRAMECTFLFRPRAFFRFCRQGPDRNRAATAFPPLPIRNFPASTTPQTRACMLVGSFSPFATTKAQRESTGDARPSIEERYRNRDDYVNRVRVAAQDLVALGFLLSSSSPQRRATCSGLPPRIPRRVDAARSPGGDAPTSLTRGFFTGTTIG